MIFSGGLVTAEHAQQIGMVNRVVADDRVLEEAVTWAAALAARPARVRGLATKAIDEGLDLPLGAGLAVEARLFSELFGD